MVSVCAIGNTHIVFLLAFLWETWRVWREGRLDQPAQRTAGLFPAAVL